MVLSEEQKSRTKKQVEFYFSDSNLPRDKFLKEKIAENAEGFVDLELLCTFSRMADVLGLRKVKEGKTKPVNPEILAQVVDVLRTSDSVEVSSDGKQVRRAKPIESPEEVAKKVDARSLYASPFPFDTSLDAATAFFNTVAPVNCVRMRRHIVSKDFRGSVFVEFASEEQAAEVLGKSLVYEGAPLHLERKADFVAKKQKDREAKAAAREAAGEATNGTGEDADAMSEGEEEPQTAPAPAEPEEKLDFEEGCLMGFDFGDASHDLSYPDIKAAFPQFGFVEFQKGGSSGIIRFKSKDGLESSLKLADDNGKVSVSGVAAAVRKLEGEEEVDFYKRAAASRRAAAERAAERSGGRGGGRGRGQKRGRGGFGGGGRGKRGRW
ncbi:Lupus La protein homolog [Coccomyxa sp. Obi]|nr:Lupus La protein homolog [Coccomyxa sp. Obi]